MSERDRIQALMLEGKISQEEADMLLEALAESEEAERELDAGSDELTALERGGNLEPPGAPEPPPSPRAGTAPAADEAEVKGWVKLSATAGSVDVSVDETLDKPAAESHRKGEFTLKEQGNDWQVTFRSARQEWPFSWGSHARLELRVPAGYGLELDGKAGTFRIDGVPFLKGSMKAGALTASGLGGLDLDMKAGTLALAMRPTSGRHRLDMKAGTATVRLLAGSDVRVEGDVKAGSATLPKGFTRKDEPVSSSFSGQLGGGRATLQLSQKAGTLVVEADGE
jgi:DUF4097 and DUF4098 domain-containing protein YvlB